mmetsp:Transcript_1976/g.2866  ORF Transcript_1976/g.2866 Transcript_1976/m.2866 type:complete len:139 (+) Transcript_1976:389-805(+)
MVAFTELEITPIIIIQRARPIMKPILQQGINAIVIDFVSWNVNENHCIFFNTHKNLYTYTPQRILTITRPSSPNPATISLNQPVNSPRRTPMPAVMSPHTNATKKRTVLTISSAMRASQPRSLNNCITFLPASQYPKP